MSNKTLWALAGIFLMAFALKLFFVTQETLIYNNDAGYYVEHIGEVLTLGYPDVPDPPIAFYYAGAFSSFLGIMLGFKVAISLASAGIAFPVYKIIEHLSRKKDIALLAAFFAAFSPVNMFMMGDLLKNMAGLFFGAWFIFFVIRATDKFTWQDALLAGVSALLMLGSHFSSSAYFMASIAPFLVLKPAYEYWKRKSISRESKFSLALLALLFLAGIGVVFFKGIDVSEGRVGVIGIYGNEGYADFPLLSEYVIFIIPLIIGFSKLKQRHLMLFLPWLVVSALLAMPLFSKPGWGFRFGWDAYILIALLSALGMGFFREKKALFYGIITVVGISTLVGFVNSGQSIHPIIYEEEWEGFRELHERRPDIVFTGAEGGIKQWLEAAGFAFTPDQSPGSHVLACDQSEEAPNSWLEGSCTMSTIYEERMADRTEEQVGRFVVVRNEEITSEDEFLNEGWDN